MLIQVFPTLLGMKIVPHPEVVCGLFKVLHGPLRVADIVLVDLCNGLVVLGRDGEAAHVRVDVHRLHQAVGRL